MHAWARRQARVSAGQSQRRASALHAGLSAGLSAVGVRSENRNHGEFLTENIRVESSYDIVLEIDSLKSAEQSLLEGKVASI